MSSRLIHSWAASALVAGAVAIACTGTLDELPSQSASGAGTSSANAGSDSSAADSSSSGMWSRIQRP
jgi:hypothetical protein